MDLLAIFKDFGNLFKSPRQLSKLFFTLIIKNREKELNLHFIHRSHILILFLVINPLCASVALI